MCGRYTLRVSPAELAEIFDLLREPELQPRYNVAPTQAVAVVRPTEGGRELSLLRWGLVPSWAEDVRIGNRMINARAESVAVKPSFRSAFQQRRCLIPADGFYEWQKTGDKAKRPYYITRRDERPFAFAGLWERWRGRDGEEIDSCTIITTGANELMRPLHDRMPVILDENECGGWLDPRARDAERLLSVLDPFPADAMRAYAVSTLVNSPKHDDPGCIEPAA